MSILCEFKDGQNDPLAQGHPSRRHQGVATDGCSRTSPVRSSIGVGKDPKAASRHGPWCGQFTTSASCKTGSFSNFDNHDQDGECPWRCHRRESEPRGRAIRSAGRPPGTALPAPNNRRSSSRYPPYVPVAPSREETRSRMSRALLAMLLRVSSPLAGASSKPKPTPIPSPSNAAAAVPIIG